MQAHLFGTRNSFWRQNRFHKISGVSSALACGAREVQDLRAAFDDSLGEEETRSQLHIMPRCAHRHAERVIAYSNFQRLFRSKAIILAAQFAVVPFGNLCQIEAAWFACQRKCSRIIYTAVILLGTEYIRSGAFVRAAYLLGLYSVLIEEECGTRPSHRVANS